MCLLLFETDIFDGVMVVIAFLTINFLHPGRLLKEDDVYEKAAEAGLA